MIKRTIDVSDKCFLKIRHKQLIVIKDNAAEGNIPVEDIGVLILQHPAISFTQSVITECQRNNVAVIFCDKKHMPVSVFLPLFKGHTLHQRVLRSQIAVPVTLYKRLWKQIVTLKIKEQAATLALLGIPSNSVEDLVKRVKSGDKENHEAQAAQKYWPLLFGDRFVRDPDLDGINGLLNYGYAIVRALVARSLVGTGLHPAIGIHHSNQYNSFCLADDMMEPFRPWVDFLVHRYAQETEKVEINRESKTIILNLLTENVTWDGKITPFMTSMRYLASNLKSIYEGAAEKLLYPNRVASFQ